MEYIVCRKAAKILGVHPNTLRKWADAGKIKHIRSASGQRRYDVDDFLGKQKESKTICYCRVSSYKQKDDLQRQIEFMRRKYPNATIVKDIGSGINFKRKGLFSILESAINGNKFEVVVAYRDRLARFGIDLIRWIIEQSGGKLVVLNQINLSPEAELTQDLLTILHVFSCRMHGLRSYKNKIAKDFANKGTKKTV
jgi:predicted site-specific integrase-resolvase